VGCRTVVPKELGKGVFAVTGLCRHISTVTHKLKENNLRKCVRPLRPLYDLPRLCA
jgi:hypothetical protein